MITLRFDYKINNFRDIHFNYNIDVNITSISEIFTMNERLQSKRGHKIWEVTYTNKKKK